MTDSGDGTQNEAVDVSLTPQEAQVVLEALRVLRNCRTFAFKDEGKTVDAVHGPFLRTLDGMGERLRATFKLK